MSRGVNKVILVGRLGNDQKFVQCHPVVPLPMLVWPHRVMA